MNIGKLFGFAKKGAKKASKSKGGSSAQSKWPNGTKIGVFGHENTGKTVFFTVLNEECKIAKGLQISVTDNLTAGEFLSHFRSVWGIDSALQTGTVVDQRGEKKFPDPTVKDKILQFTAILDRSKKIPIVTYDYSGKAISISERSEQSEKVIDFMSSADGILFFFDPKILGAELEIQARASAFVNMLEQLAPLSKRLPIPIALVVTKADTLPGYKGEAQTILIDPADEQFIADDFELFLEKILNSPKIVADSAWATSVRNILVKLREFLRVVVGRTLNFQIFFVSNTGNEPVKIGADVGRSVYAPPDKISPCGVKEPMYWLLNSIVRNKRLNVMRKIAKFTTLVSLIWILAYSTPFLYHSWFLQSKPLRVENAILNTVDNQHLMTSSAQRTEIMQAYNRYQNKWLVKELFPGYKAAASRMTEIYKGFNMGKALKRLDKIINGFSNIVKDSTLWPKYNPSKDSLILGSNHTKLLADLEDMHIGDESSVLFIRSDRAMVYWNLFTQYIKNRNDTLIAGQISEQISFDLANGENYSKPEETLGASLLEFAKVKKKVVAKQVDSQAGVKEYDKIRKKVNGSTSASYVLVKAVDELKSVKRKLIGGVHDEQISAINSFLKNVDKYKRTRNYTAKLEAVPDFGHLHIEITKNGESPTWSNETQMLEGEEVALKWKTGDDVHLAFDELKHTCSWGNQPSDKIVLKNKYALFEMEGNLTFPNIGKTVTISFKGGLKDNLPKLK